MGEDQHRGRRSSVDESVQGSAESEALVIRVGADSKDRGRARKWAKSRFRSGPVFHLSRVGLPGGDAKMATGTSLL